VDDQSFYCALSISNIGASAASITVAMMAIGKRITKNTDTYIIGTKSGRQPYITHTRKMAVDLFPNYTSSTCTHTLRLAADRVNSGLSRSRANPR
jgi:hypothetical protein